MAAAACAAAASLPSFAAAAVDFRAAEVDAIDDVASMRVHGVLKRGGTELGLSVVKKGQGRMRASVAERASSDKLVFLYRGGRLHAIRGSAEGERRVRRLRGDAAARKLFDLVALTPDFHFREKGGFDFSAGVFRGYEVELRRTSPAEGETGPGRPKTASLAKRGDGGRSVLRRATYKRSADFGGPRPVPAEIVFREPGDPAPGTLVVESVQYNPGVPDFVFDLPSGAARTGDGEP